ncbi:hypothetical protein K2173_018400 [Erythroxylum novogranatense]|uniref:Uncharacterized protein n=1 Tax=Erythroxylum novogranatense TaxID=1862640 RepID=A0AAV8UF14_9ROSI|nr:hypothetical protein K2173_018400 [Erythroxylum novogranatense]
MYMKDNGVIDSDDSDIDDLPCDSVCDDEVEYEERAVTGEALVVRRVLSARVRDEILDQRENLFHSRCLVGGKMCNLIIDGGSCTNGASQTMVKKLDLICSNHPEPYYLQWFNDSGSVKVTRQVLVPFSVGRYEDEVLCDVIPMKAGHLLLGRPWQFDKRVAHDGGDGPFQMLEKMNDTTYKIDLPDSRTNLLEEGGTDVSRSKDLEKMANSEPIGGEFNGTKPKLVHLTQILGPDTLGV